MELVLRRFESSDTVTVGRLSLNGAEFSYTLEPPFGLHGCIPPGTYPVEVTYSPRFNRPLPLVGGVPGREGIRFHSGNRARDTEGCILVGYGREGDRIWQSRAALDDLLIALGTGGPHTLTIEDAEVDA